MSFDGALIVRINNPALLEVLETYADECPDIAYMLDSRKYDFEYEYLDCAYVDGCPEDLDDLQEYLLELIKEYSEDYMEAFEDFEVRFREKYSQIKKEFSYVQWAYTPPAEEFEIPDSIVFEYGEYVKKKPKEKGINQSTTLAEIFPNMDVSKDNGLVVTDDGELVKCIWKQHDDFLGEKDGFFLPSNVVSIDHDINSFNSPGYVFNKFVITTNVEDFPSFCWYISGFKFFYIVDADTNQVVYASEEDEYISEYNFICNEDVFDDLEEIIAKYTNCPDYDEE